MGMDGLVRNSKDDVFCLVHQYERIPEWNEIIEKNIRYEVFNNNYIQRQRKTSLPTSSGITKEVSR